MGYKIECPECHNNNFYVTEENGMKYCFNCTYTVFDNNSEPKKQTPSEHIPEIRALYTQATNYYHSNIDAQAYVFLQQRGFSDKTIEQLKIGYCPIGTHPMYRNDIAKEAGLATYSDQASLGGRITFPYFYDGTTITDIRGRAIDSSEEMKYKSLYNGSITRGAIYPYNYQFHTHSQRVIITEGEIKADIAFQIGYTTLALPGMGNWRKGFKQNLNAEYIIMYDNQKKNLKHIHTAIIKTAQHIDDVKVATLPLMGKEKMDIDTFILEYGEKAFKIVVDAAISYDSWYSLQRL